MKIFSFFILGLFFFQIFISCGPAPVQKMEKHIDQYEHKEISNSRMLLELGKIFADYQYDLEVRSLYFTRMIHSGYSTSVLYTYLAQPELIDSEKDNHLILRALREGCHFELASDFETHLPPEHQEQLEALIGKAEQIDQINCKLESGKEPGLFSKRGEVYLQAGEQEMAEIDFNAALNLDTCHDEALFHKCILLFKKDSAQNVKKRLENCFGKDFSAFEQDDWQASFYQISKKIIEINNAFSREEDRLFQQAKLFVDNNFPEIALDRVKKLTELAPDNADYLALRAFVYFRLGNKMKAMEFISRAENISGKNSKLRGMIENMEE